MTNQIDKPGKGQSSIITLNNKARDQLLTADPMPNKALKDVAHKFIQAIDDGLPKRRRFPPHPSGDFHW